MPQAAPVFGQPRPTSQPKPHTLAMPGSLLRQVAVRWTRWRRAPAAASAPRPAGATPRQPGGPAAAPSARSCQGTATSY
eukprot:scaffold65816_cov25-Phaeocystis_antarctica.AAC.2